MEDMRPVVIGVPSVALGICVVFISALLTVAPHDLDQPLRQALTLFAVALPLFALTFLLLYYKLPLWQSYFVMWMGLASLGWGIFWVLQHLDATASWAYAGTLIAAVTIIVLNGAYTARRRSVAKQRAQ
jgi:hypothetical protein